MNCKFCSAELEEGAVYCPQCGKRVDGKKRCAHCGKYINENSVFCTYCGARTDGKFVCRKCGEAYDGSFCPKCGTPAQPNTASHTVTDDQQPKSKTSHILAVTKQSVLYGALCVLFIFSFFVTFSLITTTEIVAVRTDINSTSFYFLITQFQEISDFLASGTYYPEMSAAMYLDAGICAACVAAIIIICATYFALGTVAYVKKYAGKERICHEQICDHARPFDPCAYFIFIIVCFRLHFAGRNLGQHYARRHNDRKHSTRFRCACNRGSTSYHHQCKDTKTESSQLCSERCGIGACFSASRNTSHRHS